jgi:hypothetical protein
MLGLFITHCRCGCEWTEELQVAEWLRELQAEQVEGFATVRVQSRWWRCRGGAEVERGRSLFESLLVFENYTGGYLSCGSRRESEG